MPVSLSAGLGVILATVLAAGLVGIGRGFRRPNASGGDDASRGMRAVSALALGIAYVVGHVGIARPAFPPLDVTDRIPVVALAGAVLAGWAAMFRPSLRVRAAGLAFLLVLTLGLMLGPVLGGDGLLQEVRNWLAATTLTALLAWVNLGAIAALRGSAETSRALLITAMGASLALVLSGCAVPGQLAGVLSIALGATMVAGWGQALGGEVPVASGILTALVVEGFVYAFLPAPSALLLAAAPGAAWLTRVGPGRNLGPGARAVVGMVLILVPVAIAVVLAFTASPSYDV